MTGLSHPETSGTPLVVSAFPATGKTHLARRHSELELVDSDSSAFHWQWRGPETRERHRDWPNNYVEHIVEQARGGRTVLCSTHQEIRDALNEAHVPFLLVYPRADLRRQYVGRVRDRAYDAELREDSTERAAQTYLADKLEGEWVSLMRSLQAQDGCAHVVLGADEYLRWPL